MESDGLILSITAKVALKRKNYQNNRDEHKRKQSHYYFIVLNLFICTNYSLQDSFNQTLGEKKKCAA